MSSSFAPMKIEDIGHGRVERRVTINGRERVRGDELTHADIASMAIANRNAMIENRFITVFPKSVEVRRYGGSGPASAAVEGEFHIVTVGFGKYRVIKGLLLLDGVTKDAAAEFVATAQANPAAAAQAAPLSPAKPAQAAPKRPRGKRQLKPRTPAPGAPQDNGPLE